MAGRRDGGRWAPALALALAWGFVMSSPARAAESPEALAKLIVDSTVGSTSEPVVAEFEPAFAKAYRTAEKNTGDLVIDFDWMTNSQDPDIEAIGKTIDTRIESGADGKARIRVSFHQATGQMVIDYVAAKTGEDWRLTDVVYPEEGFSLRELVTGQ